MLRCFEGEIVYLK